MLGKEEWHEERPGRGPQEQPRKKLSFKALAQGGGGVSMHKEGSVFSLRPVGVPLHTPFLLCPAWTFLHSMAWWTCVYNSGLPCCATSGPPASGGRHLPTSGRCHTGRGWRSANTKAVKHFPLMHFQKWEKPAEGLGDPGGQH